MVNRLLSSLILAGALGAQSPNIVGDWQGTLDVGTVKLRLGFHITSNDQGELASTIDSLDQNVLGIPVQRTTFRNPDLHLEMPKLQDQYDGTVNKEGNEIAGTFTQGIARPLTLKRVAKIGLPSRSQDPKPPYPYDAEEVGYDNHGIHLAGTLTLPRGPGPFAAALMITGSGPQDRDHSLMGHKPFWVIADYLARRGIAVLRVDDRGMGKSTGNSTLATMEDMAGDVLAGIGYLKSHDKINRSRIGVIGHSEGGMVGPLSASRSSDVRFVVMLAGMGVSFEQSVDTHYSQSEVIMRAAGATEEAIAWNNALQKMIFGVLRSESDSKAAIAKMNVEMRRMMASVPEARRKALEDPASAGAANSQFTLVTLPEMTSLFLFDPGKVLRQLKAPVLALNGSRDMQVSARLHLPAIAAALAEAGNDDFAVMELPGLNHLFQKCDKCTLAEYGELEETFSPTALAIMGDWLVYHTRIQDQ